MIGETFPYTHLPLGQVSATKHRPRQPERADCHNTPRAAKAGALGSGLAWWPIVDECFGLMDYTRGRSQAKELMKLAIMLLCSGLGLGQNTSPAAPSAATSANSVDLRPAHGCPGSIDILSDPLGVDFGPYLQRLLQDVRENWLRAIPKSAEMYQGNVTIEFAITKDGNIADMHLVGPSNKVLDRAAWVGISASNPFRPLPSDFTGPYLALRMQFCYNPDESDLTRVEVSISPPGDLQVPVGESKIVTATVTGTKENAVEWLVTGTACSGSACGKMADKLYLAPSVLPDPPVVTLTAVSKADPTARASVTVHIVEAPSH